MNLGPLLVAQGDVVGLDLKALETIVFINSVTTLCITKLDVLDGFAEIQVCVDYDEEQNPIYTTLPGWQQETSGIRDFNDLPQAAQDYILFIEGVLGLSCWHSFSWTL